jgi:hypothetical protein
MTEISRNRYIFDALIGIPLFQLRLLVASKNYCTVAAGMDISSSFATTTLLLWPGGATATACSATSETSTMKLRIKQPRRVDTAFVADVVVLDLCGHY